MTAPRYALVSVLLAALLPVAAMAHPRHRPLPVATPLPLPPTPPPGGPPDLMAPRPGPLTPAPVIYAEGPSVSPAWFGEHSVNTSQGFTPGSQVQARPTGRMELAPGLEFRVPLK